MEIPLQFGGTLGTAIDWLRLPGVNVLVALLIVLVGWYLSGLLASALRGNVSRRFERRSVANLALRGCARSSSSARCSSRFPCSASTRGTSSSR